MTDFIDWPEFEGELPPSLEWLLGKLAAALGKLTGALQKDRTQLEAWYNEFYRYLVTYIQAAYMAGQDSQYIGRTESGHIYEYVKAQVDYLNNFRLVIQSAEEWNAGWNARAESYARGIVAPYWKGRTKVLPLPAIPGDMSTDCGQMCACLWEIETLDEEAGDYDAYWRLNASRVVQTEHCQNCQVRASEWAPLRIRGGRLIVDYGNSVSKEFWLHD